VANAFYQSVDFFDYASGENIGTLTGLIAQPHELAVDNERRRLFLSQIYRSGAYGSGNEPGHEISIIDVDLRSVADVIDIHPFVSSRRTVCSTPTRPACWSCRWRPARRATASS
jgi:hypothetical protein